MIKSERVTFPGAFGYDLAARLDAPSEAPRAHALFVHCFTCSKDLKATVRISRALVERGEAKFGILYQSDVTANSWIEAAGVFPPESHRKIRYEIALTRAAAKDAGAQKFHEWLLGAAAGEIFARFGFEVK